MAVLSKPIVNLIDVYGPNYGPGWRPSIRNIILGVDQVDTHHCMICDKVPTKFCYEHQHMGYCTALILNALGLLELCGERLSVRSDGCGKPGHQFRDGVNRWMKDGLDGREPTMPDLPHVVLGEMFQQFQHFLRTGHYQDINDDEMAPEDNAEEGQEGTENSDDTIQDDTEEIGEMEQKPWEKYNTKPLSYNNKCPPPPKEKTKPKKFATGKIVNKFQSTKEAQEKKDVAKIESGKPKREEVPTLLTRIPGSDLQTLRYLTDVYLTSHGLMVSHALKRKVATAVITGKTVKATKTKRAMAANSVIPTESRFAAYSDSTARQVEMERFSQLYTESVEDAAKKQVFDPITAGKVKSKGKLMSVAATIRGSFQGRKPRKDENEDKTTPRLSITQASTVAGKKGRRQA
jgi:hypothetical protein